MKIFTRYLKLMSLLFFTIVMTDLFADQIPVIVKENGNEKLILPQKAIALISSLYPDTRIPDSSDIKGLWSSFKKPGKFPFVTWGDFTGNGETDIAVLLLGPGSYGSGDYDYTGNYVEIILNQKNGEYLVEYENRRKFVSGDVQIPQQIIYRILSKQTILDVTETEKFQQSNDSLIRTYYEVESGILYWGQSKYVEYLLPGYDK